jgi:hypothetical protein
MRLGFLITRPPQELPLLQWVVGPERSWGTFWKDWWNGNAVKKTLSVRGFRCERCGRLELYADG